MAFGLFDPPQTRAQKHAAAAACKLREQAGRDANIEIEMLARRHAHGINIANSGRERTDVAMTDLRLALYEAQDIIDRTNDFADAFFVDRTDISEAARDAASYERLATFELEARDILLSIRDDARTQVGKLGMACMEADTTIGRSR